MDQQRPVIWIGSSKKDFLKFPSQVRNEMGHALYIAQKGEKHRDAKPLRGFRGGSVVEISIRDEWGTYRTMYTIQFKEAVIVLHAFQKKSTSGIKTPKHEIDLVEQRLKAAQGSYKEWLSGNKTRRDQYAFKEKL